MSSAINNLKTTLAMGARANKYRVQIAAPLGPTDDTIIDTLCKGGDIPGKTIGQIEVYNQGRKVVLAGDAEFESEWTLTFWNTQNHDTRGQFIDWMTFIDSVETHSRGAGTHDDYMSSGAMIHQLNTSDNSVTASYQFNDLWPNNIGSIAMADETQDEIEEYEVTFSFSYWTKTA